MQQNMTYLRQIVERLRTDSPRFFKALQWAFAVIFIAVLTANSLISSHTVEVGVSAQKWVNWLNTLMGGAFGAFVISLLPSVDPKVMDDKTKKNVVEDVVVNNPEVITKAQMENLMEPTRTVEGK